jgi:hypothetical protein
LKLLNAVSEAVMASVAIVSMYSFSLDFLPEPYNSLLLGGGAGVLAATAVAASGRGKKRKAVGVVGELPGVPAEKSRKSPRSAGKPAERELLMRRYDKAFTEMLTRHDGESRSDVLERMRPIIYQLSPDIKAWTGDARIRMYLLLQELSKDLDNPSCSTRALDVLFLVLSKGGSAAVEMARPMFREKIQAMYDKSAHENERFLPRLLLMLDDYDPAAVENLTKDAIYVWGDDRFRTACEYLGLETMRERGLRSRVKGLIGAEITKAGNGGNVTALCRAMDLYQAVR